MLNLITITNDYKDRNIGSNFKRDLENKFEAKAKTSLALYRKIIIDEIKNTDDEKLLRQFLEDDATRIVFDKLVSNKASLRVTYSKINSESRKKFGRYAPTIQLDRHISMKINQENKKKVEDKNEKVININIKDIEKLADDLSRQSGFREKAILAGLSSGCRMIEILKLSEFKIIDDKTVEQSHIAKSRPDKKINKPLIFVDSKTFIKLISDIRNEAKTEGENSEVTNRYQQSLNSRLRRLVAEWNLGRTDTRFHLLRKIYANYSFQTIPNNYSMVGWIRQVLGHDNMNSLCHYTTVKLVTEQKTSQTNLEMYRNKRGDPLETKKKKLKELIITFRRLRCREPNSTDLRRFGYGSSIVREIMSEM